MPPRGKKAPDDLKQWTRAAKAATLGEPRDKQLRVLKRRLGSLSVDDGDTALLLIAMGMEIGSDHTHELPGLKLENETERFKFLGARWGFWTAVIGALVALVGAVTCSKADFSALLATLSEPPDEAEAGPSSSTPPDADAAASK